MYPHNILRMFESTAILCRVIVVSTFLASVLECTVDEKPRIAVRLNPPTQTLYSSVLQLPFFAAINMEIDVEFSDIPSGQPYSNMHMMMFLSYSKGAEGEANHTLLDQPLSSNSYRHKMQLQLMTFNQFAVRVVVTNQVLQIIRRDCSSCRT